MTTAVDRQEVAPFDRAARLYLGAGLWPMPVLGKDGLLRGVTGYRGTVTAEKVEGWLHPDPVQRARNGRGSVYNGLSLRHQGTLAIDVDVRNGKDGARWLRELAERKNLSPLPATFSSTARGATSPCRQYIYRVEQEAPRYETKPCHDVELCVYHHRHTVAWPTLHEDLQVPYEWYEPGEDGVPPSWGPVAKRIPHRDEFAVLPRDWFDLFRRGQVDSDPDALVVDLPEFLATVPEGTPDGLVRHLIAKWSDPDQHVGHDEFKKAGVHALLLGREGHPGVPVLFELLVERLAAYLQEKRPEKARVELYGHDGRSGLVQAVADIAQRKPLKPLTLPGVATEGTTVQPGPASSAQPPGIDPQNPRNPPWRSSSEGFEGASPEEWEPPTPLPGRTDPIPTDAAGPILGPLAEDIGRGLQVPTDLPMNLALPLITTAAKGAWVAEVESGWTEPVCVATLSALPSGERKSPTLRLLDQPLRDFERAAQAAKRPEIAQQVAKKKLAEGRVEETRKKALKGLDDGAHERAYLDEVAKHAAIAVDPLPRWLVDDSTPEAFVSLLAEHGSIGAVSAEPGLFGILAGRYSSGSPNIEWLLKATSGEALTVDRIGREPEQVDNPALSIACCIQPGRLVELGKVKAFRESGLLARWFYAVPQSAVGERTRTRPIQPHLTEAWSRHLGALAEAGAKRRDAGRVSPVQLTEEARDELERFRGSIEPHLHPDHGKYAGIADWMNKLPGGAVRIAAALTLLADPDALHIEGTTMADAVRIAEAYISHAIVAFGLTRPNAEVYSQAKQVLAVARRLADEDGTVTRREVHQKIRDRAWVENADSLTVPLGILVDHGFIRRAPMPAGAVGRPSESYELNPHSRRIDPQNAQNHGQAPRSRGSEGFEGASPGVGARTAARAAGSTAESKESR